MDIKKLVKKVVYKIMREEGELVGSHKKKTCACKHKYTLGVFFFFFFFQVFLFNEEMYIRRSFSLAPRTHVDIVKTKAHFIAPMVHLTFDK